MRHRERTRQHRELMPTTQPAIHAAKAMLTLIPSAARRPVPTPSPDPIPRAPKPATPRAPKHHRPDLHHPIQDRHPTRDRIPTQDRSGVRVRFHQNRMRRPTQRHPRRPTQRHPRRPPTPTLGNDAEMPWPLRQPCSVPTPLSAGAHGTALPSTYRPRCDALTQRSTQQAGPPQSTHRHTARPPASTSAMHPSPQHSNPPSPPTPLSASPSDATP